ncbi:MAG: hypothetical protein ACK5H1_05610 [Tenacibaculum sp.]
MNFLNKLFNLHSKPSKEKSDKPPINLNLEELFAYHFIRKDGKFLYSENTDELVLNLTGILKENHWTHLSCTNLNLLKIAKKVNTCVLKASKNPIHFFTPCEHLIANKGYILFSSNQLGSYKLAELPENFIVYATTSQLVKNTHEALTDIKTNYTGNIPTNISAISNYTIQNNKDNFLDYKNSNSKNLYLLLFENL